MTTRYADEAYSTMLAYKYQQQLAFNFSGRDLRDYGYAPGHYTIECVSCGRHRFAGKGALRCYECAIDKANREANEQQNNGK